MFAVTVTTPVACAVAANSPTTKKDATASQTNEDFRIIIVSLQEGGLVERKAHGHAVNPPIVGVDRLAEPSPRDRVARHRDAVPARFADTVSLEAHQKAADYTLAQSIIGQFQ